MSIVLGHTLLVLTTLLSFGIYKYRLGCLSQDRARNTTVEKVRGIQLDKLLDGLPTAIMIIDKEMKITCVNEACEQLLGCDRNKLVGKNFSELQQWSRCLTHKDLKFSLPPRQIEFTGQNGEKVNVSLETRPLMRKNCREGTIINFRISNNETKYELLEQTFDKILQQMTGGVIVVDSTGRIVLNNRVAEEITGLPSSSMVGKPIWDVFPKDEKELVTLQALKKGEAAGPAEVQYRLNGKDSYLLVTSDVLRNREGQVSGAVTVLHDITELHRQQELQHHQEKLAIIGQMAAGMAHELRNPLTSIKGFAQLLYERLEDTKNKEYLDVIIQEVDRTNEIISNFLILARPSSHKRENVHLDRLIDELLPLIESQCLLTQVELVRNLSPELPPIKAQPDQLKQVVLNLIHNALQAMEGQAVRILTL
ncbi:MAG: PAS domain-containing protein, partial [Desulfofundulus sp.]